MRQYLHTLRMHPIVWIAILWLWPMIVLADDPKQKDNPKDDKPATPAEEYQALTKEYQAAEQEFFKQYQEAKTDEERAKLFE